jgi:hypothetical protein|nr:hypothetical protein [Delftia sp. PE138]
MTQSKADGSPGQYFAHALRSACGNCGRSMDKAHRIHHGVKYCSICYPAVFPPRTCQICGETARAHKHATSSVCGKCARQDRTCLRCGRLTPQAALRVGDRVACASCAPYYRTSRPCDTCGTPSARLSRSRGFPERGQMCERCLRKVTQATCSHCHKHRTQYFMTLAGCHLCSKCCELDGPSHDCPDCGSRVQGTGFSPCFSCSIKRGNVKRQQSAQHMLVTQQAKQLYADFTQWGNSSQRASKLAAHASRYLQFITRIDIALQQASVPLDQAVLLETFTTQELRQMGLLMQFLVEQGAFLQDAAARRQNSDEALVQSKLKGATGKPWAADLQAFDTALAQRQKPLNVRSRKSYLSAAIALLTAAKVGRATQLKQEAVDALLRSKPGLRASLTPYLSHLASRHGMRLKVPGKRTAPRQSLLPQARYARLLMDAIAGKPPRPTELSLTATLLAHLLNVPLTQILQLRHQDVDWATGLQMRLKDRWMEVPQEVGAFVRALQSPEHLGGSDFNPWVFPGRLISDCLSTSAVSYHLRKYEIPTNRKQARH